MISRPNVPAGIAASPRRWQHAWHLSAVGIDMGTATFREGGPLRLSLIAIFGVMLLSALAPLPAQAGPTLDAIKARGEVRCGINVQPGYSAPDAQGNWSGIWYDLCRAVAATSLGDATRIELIPVESNNRFSALSSGGIDILLDGATINLERETKLNLAFPVVWLYDGQSFMAHRSLGLKSLHDAKDVSICVTDGTTTRQNLDDFLTREHIASRVIGTQTEQGAWQAYLKGRCDIMTQDHFSLISHLSLDAENPTDHILLPEVISKEPLGPALRSDDPQWIKLVRWTVYALIAAEEHGLTAANIDKAPTGAGAEVDLLAGRGPDYAETMGIQPGWAKRLIAQVGNYGEIFSRNFGDESPLKTKRGINALWTKGGLIYAPPVR